MKIKFKSNNMLPVDKNVNMHLATVIIRSTFAQDGKYYPELIQMMGFMNYKNCQNM